MKKKNGIKCNQLAFQEHSNEFRLFDSINKSIHSKKKKKPKSKAIENAEIPISEARTSYVLHPPVAVSVVC